MVLFSVESAPGHLSACSDVSVCNVDSFWNTGASFEGTNHHSVVKVIVSVDPRFVCFTFRHSCALDTSPSLHFLSPC